MQHSSGGGPGAAVRYALPICIVLGAACGALFPANAEAGLLLHEILSAPVTDWNGDGEVHFKDDEWVEILNTGPGVEVLDGVFLRDGTGDTYHYGFNGVLLPGELAVVYGHQAVVWQQAEGLATTGLSLNNSGDRLELWRDTAAPRVLDFLDSVNVPAHAAEADRSFGRRESSLEWILFDGHNPYAGLGDPPATGCLPTPGVNNFCEPLPLRGESWSRLRSLFIPSSGGVSPGSAPGN